MRQVAILGGDDKTLGSAPFEDDAWELWAMPWRPLPRVSRYFEMHSYWRKFEGAFGTSAAYLDFLNDCGVPVYMQQKEEDVPMSVRYPLDAVAMEVGTSYLESTIGYMLGLAILERVDRIGLWGVDMSDAEEYGQQRPNCEYLIGLARGRGIDVVIPERSALLKSKWSAGVYGLEDPNGDQHV